MSGFEIVGVVLGSLPLIISAIESYEDLAQTVRRARKYTNELKNLKHDLYAESTIFLDTLERVLDGLVSAKQLEELLKDPAGAHWQDETLNHRLKDRLGRSYSIFTHSVDDMNATVQEFIKRLDLDDQGKVRWAESTGFKLALKRAGFSLRKRDFDDLIQRLQKHNGHLEKFTNRSIEFEPSRQKRRQSSRLQKLKEHAKSVFHALEASFGCDCQDSSGHTTLFKLGPQSSPVMPQSSQPQEQIEFLLVVSGSVPQKTASFDEAIIWQEISLESAEDVSEAYAQIQLSQSQPLECISTASAVSGKPVQKGVRFLSDLQIRNPTSSRSSSCTTLTQNTSPDELSTQSNLSASSTSKSQPQDSQISSMCKMIRNSPVASPSSCLGYIADGARKFFLHPRARSSHPDKACWSTISLQQVLHSTVGSVPPLTPWDRLTLAATIASAVLQLHASPWLDPTWNTDDVLFLQREGERLYKQAFVSQQFCHSNKAAIKSSGVPIFNETLFALAVVLVELSLGPLEALQTQEDLRAGIYANMVTLSRLVENDEIGIAFGPRYQSAVKRCIELAKVANSLDEQIQQDLYDGVVLTLEDQAMRKDSAP